MDFEARRAAYYGALNLTPDASAFTRKIQAELERELRLLNAEIPRNDKVRILWRGENRISITPFDPLPEPQGLQSVKSEIGRRWQMTELLDVLKEAALDIGFLDAFETSAARVALSRGDLDRRLILVERRRREAGLSLTQRFQLAGISTTAWKFTDRDAHGPAATERCRVGSCPAGST